MSRFKGKIAVITGAGGHLGKAVSELLYSEEAKLALIDQTRSKLERVSKNMDLNKVLLLEGDLSDEQTVKKVVTEIVSYYGRIDLLVNIVGGFTMGPPIQETSEDDLDQMLKLNLKPTFLMSKHVVPIMTRQKSGKIVNIGAKPALRGVANMAPYSIAKSAVISLTESLSDEVKELGINVNAVLPSIIDTPVNRKEMPDANFNKWVKPNELARVIAFLLSNDSDPIHGVALPVFGLVD